MALTAVFYFFHIFPECFRFIIHYICLISGFLLPFICLSFIKNQVYIFLFHHTNSHSHTQYVWLAVCLTFLLLFLYIFCFMEGRGPWMWASMASELELCFSLMETNNIRDVRCFRNCAKSNENTGIFLFFNVQGENGVWCVIRTITALTSPSSE